MQDTRRGRGEKTIEARDKPLSKAQLPENVNGGSIYSLLAFLGELACDLAVLEA
jgi:hypothetical protein